jgi:hypothetical protein
VNVRDQRQERPHLDCVLRRLKLGADDAGEIAAIRGLWRTAEQHRSATTVRLTGPRIITSGWAAWCRTTSDQRRVIFLFLMPGDVITPAVGGGSNDCDLIAVTRLCSVDAAGLTAVGPYPAPTARAWIDNADQDYRSRLLDHLAWLNDGSALRNLARLVLELHDRSHDSGRCVDGRFDLPIGQRVLAQALGLSAVQVNKVLQQLREAGMVSAERGWLRIDDAPALRSLADGVTKTRKRPVNTLPGDAHATALMIAD